MTNIKIPEENKYFPDDTIKVFKDLENFNSKNNFYYLFNTPKVSRYGRRLKIAINEDIDKFEWKEDLLKNISERQSYIINQVKQKGYSIGLFEANLLWRLVIGLGSSHPQEVSMTLHHIYGIPYIPGSAIKGVTKHWVTLNLAEKLKGDNLSFEEATKRISKFIEDGTELDIEINDTKFKDLIDIFGTQKQEGQVIFMDSYPISEINLKIDIMNPHYPKYYSGNEPPADWQSPNPIKFLTVEKTPFRFYILSKNPRLLTLAENWLKDALNNTGIGAKTSLGYGIFEL